MIRTFLAGALLALAACASAPQAPAAPDFYVMRHLHKTEGSDPGLTPQGRACAARLAEQLADDGIGAIYVSATRRARETAAPLAARLGIAAASYDPGDTPGLVARVRPESGSVLVVGHSNTVPEIVAQLGGTRPAPIAEDRFADIWKVPGSGGATEHMRIEGC